MATETTAAGRRANPLLLVALAVAGLGYAGYVMFSGPAAPASVPTTPPGKTQAAANGGPIEPGQLDVRVEALKRPQPAIAEGGRNPFSMAPPPPPPMPEVKMGPKVPPAPITPAGPPPPPPPPPGPPPIGNTIKFIGIAETSKGKIGAFSVWDQTTRECKATFPGREGEVIEGRYRVVRIGIESAVLEYVNGEGKTTLPLNGQACVSK